MTALADRPVDQLTGPLSPDHQPWPLFAVAADLAPAEVAQARHERTLRLVAAAIVAVAIVVTAGWSALAFQQTASARGQLQGKQAQYLALQHQQAGFGQLVTDQATIGALTAQLHQLMTSDTTWGTLLPAVRSAAPAGVGIGSIAGSLTAASNSPTTPTSTAPVGNSAAIGSLTVSGTAADQATVAGFADALGRLPGLANPFVANTTEQPGAGFQFTIQLDVTRAALGGRWSGAMSGGHK